MINGKLLNTFTILPKILLKIGCGMIPPCSSDEVTCKRTPIGSPKIKENRVEKNTITRASPVALITRLII